MRIYNCKQGTEQWEEIRRGRPTASRFSDILTPSQLKLSKSRTTYAIQLAAQIKRVETPPKPPTFEMERGLEMAKKPKCRCACWISTSWMESHRWGGWTLMHHSGNKRHWQISRAAGSRKTPPAIPVTSAPPPSLIRSTDSGCHCLAER